MDNNNQELKIKSVEPKIFSLVLRHDRGSYLHTNIHYSLEEAYRDARFEMEQAEPTIIGTNVALDMWNTMSVSQIKNGLFGPQVVRATEAPVVKPTLPNVDKNTFYRIAKNKEKNKIIESILADPSKLETFKTKLTKADIMFINEKIKNK